MPCPFLSRLSTQFVKNYSGKLLKTYGDHCPVASTGVVHFDKSLASPAPTVRALVPSKDDIIEVKETKSK